MTTTSIDKHKTAKYMLGTSQRLIDSLMMEAKLLQQLPPNTPVLQVTASNVPTRAHLIVVPYCGPETFKALPATPFSALPPGLSFDGVPARSLPSSTLNCRVLDVLRDREGGCRWFTQLGDELVEVVAKATSLDFSTYEEQRIEGTRLSVFRQFLGASPKRVAKLHTREPLAIYEEAKAQARATLKATLGSAGVRAVAQFNILSCSQLRNGKGLPDHVRASLAASGLTPEQQKTVMEHVHGLPPLSLADQEAFVKKELLSARKWVRSFFRNICDAQKNALCIQSLNRMFTERTGSGVTLSLVSKQKRGTGNVIEYQIGMHFRSQFLRETVTVHPAEPGQTSFCWVTLSKA